MRYYYVEKHELLPPEIGEVYEGQLITERETAKMGARRRKYIEDACILVEWPAKHTKFVNGIRYRTAEKCIIIRPNGEPYGAGWVGTECNFPSDCVGVYLGDISPTTKVVWRFVAVFRDAILVEES